MAGIFKAYDVRGTYPDQLDETTAFRIGYYFHDLLDAEDLARGPVVVVSRDMRSHSVSLVRSLKNGLRARGIAVIDIGVADTPQNYFGTGFLGASGGIQVTASHNPAVYNGFKMSRRDAIPVSYELPTISSRKQRNRIVIYSPNTPSMFSLGLRPRRRP
jgi:phosphomannomutase